MPFRTIPGTSIEYALISFDQDGKERVGDPDAAAVSGGGTGKLSDRLIDQLANEPITNVFFFTHGWNCNWNISFFHCSGNHSLLFIASAISPVNETLKPGFQIIFVFKL